MIIGLGCKVHLDGLEQDRLYVDVQEHHVREYVAGKMPRILTKEGVAVNIMLEKEGLEILSERYMGS